jgi:tetratricopeptide (TPR) repeat protein
LTGPRKSQIAIEYSYRVRLKSPHTWVFWVYASTVTRFEQSYRDIADALKLPGRDDPQVDMLRLVSRWLADESNGPWFLVLDNADNTNMFSYLTPQMVHEQGFDSSKALLLAYIPQTATGSILITSRNTDSAYKLSGDYKNIIHISPMDESEALELLKTKLPWVKSAPNCLELLTALDHVPLAVTQAAAYVSKGAPRMGISRYLDLFNESESNRTSLLDEDAGDLRRDPEVPNSVITTWHISFNQIRRDNPFAADLLSLMSVLNRQGIPESLLVKNNDRLLFEAALALLLGFSLVVAESTGNHFEMHRLVQLATRKWLVIHNESDKWNQTALRLLAETFPNGDYQNWKLCGRLLPHVEAVLSNSFHKEIDLLQQASILHNLSWYLWAKGDYQLSRFKIEEALEIRRLYLDKGDRNLLGSFGLYGTVLHSQGKYDEAETMHRQELQLCEEVLGQRHPDTLRSMNNLAVVLKSQGKYDEAEAMHRQTLQLREEVLGQRHPDTLTSMNNLAGVLGKQGKYDEAETMHRQTLQLREEVLGQRHPDTLTSMNNVAGVLESQGKYDEAETMQRQVLQLREEVLGQKHPSSLNSVYNLGYLLQSRKKYDDASVLYQRACLGYEEVLGINHPTTLACSRSYSSMLEKMK